MTKIVVAGTDLERISAPNMRDESREMRQLVKTIAAKISETIFECEDGDEV